MPRRARRHPVATARNECPTAAGSPPLELPLYTTQPPALPVSESTWSDAMPHVGCHANRGVPVVSTRTITVWESLHVTMGSKPRLSEQANDIATRHATS